MLVGAIYIEVRWKLFIKVIHLVGELARACICGLVESLYMSVVVAFGLSNALRLLDKRKEQRVNWEYQNLNECLFLK